MIRKEIAYWIWAHAVSSSARSAKNIRKSIGRSIVNRKVDIGIRISGLEEAVELKLRHIRTQMAIVIASSVITSLTAIGAITWSDALGAITTVVAGVSGTGGIIGYAKDSLLSYSSTKTDLSIKIKNLKGKLNACNDDVCFDEIEKAVDKVYESLSP
ncbi:MAG: hypothetical protein AB1793_06845 [Candidatus Thermoplasmatota archaeon]